MLAYRMSTVAPTLAKVKASCNLSISRLNYAASVLAVYASQILSPRPMQDSLPVACSALLDEVHGFPWPSLGQFKRFLPNNPPFTSFRVATQDGRPAAVTGLIQERQYF